MDLGVGDDVKSKLHGRTGRVTSVSGPSTGAVWVHWEDQREESLVCTNYLKRLGPARELLVREGQW